MTTPLAILAAFALGSLFGALVTAFFGRTKPKPMTDMQRALASTFASEMRVSRMHEIQDEWSLAHRTDSDGALHKGGGVTAETNMTPSGRKPRIQTSAAPAMQGAPISNDSGGVESRHAVEQCSETPEKTERIAHAK